MKALLVAGTAAAVAATPGAAPRSQPPLDLEARRAAIAPRLAQQPESRVVSSRTRAALTIDTSAGPVVLWAAPTRGGGRCYLVDIQALPVASGGAACTARPSRPGFGVRPWHTETRVGDRMLELLGARTAPNVASVEVRFADGSREALRPSGGFVLRELEPGEEPVSVVARDERGAALERRPMPGPRSFRRELPFPIAAYRTVIELGATASLAVAPGTNGTVCVRTTHGRAESWSCGAGPASLATRALSVHRYGRLLEGEVGGEIERLEVWYEDGGAARIPVVERYALFQLPRRRIPRLLVGLDRSGAIVARQRL